MYLNSKILHVRKKILKDKKKHFDSSQHLLVDNTWTDFSKWFQTWIMTRKSHWLIKWKHSLSYGNIIFPFPWFSEFKSRRKSQRRERRCFFSEKCRHTWCGNFWTDIELFYVPIHMNGIESLGWLFSLNFPSFSSSFGVGQLRLFPFSSLPSSKSSSYVKVSFFFVIHRSYDRWMLSLLSMCKMTS